MTKQLELPVVEEEEVDITKSNWFKFRQYKRPGTLPKECSGEWRQLSFDDLEVRQ